MSKHANETEILKEGTWYIRGCKELVEYFQNNKIGLRGFSSRLGYYYDNGKHN